MSIRMGTTDLGVAFVGDVADLQRSLGAADSAVDRFGRNAKSDLDQVAAKANAAGGAFDRLATAAKTAFVGGSLAVGLIKLKNIAGSAVSSLIDAQLQLDKLNVTMQFAAGGRAAEHIAFLRSEVDRLGLDLGVAAKQYGAFSAATLAVGVQAEKSQRIFTSISQTAVTLGLSAEQTERAIAAVIQSFSKGQVMAEEIRGQWGEHIPGAFEMAAQAMGVTAEQLNKDMEAGLIKPLEFWSDYGEFLMHKTAGTLSEATQTMQADLNRLSTSWLNLKQQVVQAGVGDAISGGINLLQTELNALADTLENGRERGDGFFMTMVNGLGLLAGRAVLQPIEKSANALLSSLFDLSVQVDLMSDDFYGAGEKARVLAERQKEAEARAEELQRQLARFPENIYDLSELANLKGFIQDLKNAQTELGRLKTAAGNPYAAEDSRLGRYNQRAVDQQKELAALGKFNTKYATPQERLAAEMAAQKTALGSQFGPEQEARIRAHFSGGGGGGGRASRAKSDKDPFADLLGRLTSKDAGLDPSFNKDLQTLYDGYQKGRVGVDEYRSAVELLIGTQQFAKDALNDKRKAIEAEDKANKDALKSLRDTVEQAQKGAAEALKSARAAEEEADAVGKSAGQLHDLELARLADTSAALRQRAAIMENIDLSGEASEALRDEAEATDRLAKARSQIYLKNLAEEGERITQESGQRLRDEADQRRESLADSIGDGILDGSRRGAGYMEIFRNELEAQFARMVLRPAIQPVANAADSLIQSGLSALMNFISPSVGPPSAASAYSLSGPGGGLGLKLPALATGTNYVPQDMLAMLHKGEAVQPAAYNPALGGVGSPAGDVIVNVINPAGQPAAVRSQRETTGADGSRIIELVLESVGDSLANRSGPVARGLESGYGVRPAMA